MPFFLAMEFISNGEPLDARLQHENIVPVPEVLRHRPRDCRRAWPPPTRGWSTATSSRPTSGWRTPSERVKILDFGLARAEADDRANLTQPGHVVGTPAYMAPEQARGERADHRCDLFSLGGVLYLLCTRQLPFRADRRGRAHVPGDGDPTGSPRDQSGDPASNWGSR